MTYINGIGSPQKLSMDKTRAIGDKRVWTLLRLVSRMADLTRCMVCSIR